MKVFCIDIDDYILDINKRIMISESDIKKRILDMNIGPCSDDYEYSNRLITISALEDDFLHIFDMDKDELYKIVTEKRECFNLEHNTYFRDVYYNDGSISTIVTIIFKAGFAYKYDVDDNISDEQLKLLFELNEL